MLIQMKQILFSIFFLFSFLVEAQEINGGPVNIPAVGVIDGVYIQEHTPTKRLVPYEFVRESDVMFSKRVWRTIDLREKINHPLYFPFDHYTGGQIWVKNTTRWSLWTVLKHHIMKGDLIMYDNENPNEMGTFDGDLFKYPVYPAPGKNFETDSLFKNEVFRLIAQTTQKIDAATGAPVVKTDPITGEPIMKLNPTTNVEEPVLEDPNISWVCSEDIVEYRLKEDWFFDKERSQLDCRILGIAPVVYADNELKFIPNANPGNKVITSKKILFWLYFPHCRFVLVNYNIYNPKNDAQWMSFDDLFNKRQFNSTIYKQSNTFDRTIDTYKAGVDALFESQRITEELRNFEHDLWQF
jgi:gliding motility associated protien GldN